MSFLPDDLLATTPARNLSSPAVPAFIGVSALQASIYDVPGGYRAVMFDRFQVRLATPFGTPLLDDRSRPEVEVGHIPLKQRHTDIDCVVWLHLTFFRESKIL